MRSPHFFELARPRPLRKRHGIVSKKWPSSIWRYAKRWSQRFSAGAQRDRRARIAKPATGSDLVTVLARFAKCVGMTNEAWQRHANPWSVYTRFAAIPAGLLAIWSRTLT